jgi:hypothetical protein
VFVFYFVEANVPQLLRLVLLGSFGVTFLAYFIFFFDIAFGQAKRYPKNFFLEGAFLPYCLSSTASLYASEVRCFGLTQCRTSHRFSQNDNSDLSECTCPRSDAVARPVNKKIIFSLCKRPWCGWVSTNSVKSDCISPSGVGLRKRCRSDLVFVGSFLVTFLDKQKGK